jgi:hypothetical protein
VMGLRNNSGLYFNLLLRRAGERGATRRGRHYKFVAVQADEWLVPPHSGLARSCAGGSVKLRPFQTARSASAPYLCL